MTTGTPITNTLNITQDDVMGIVRRIIKVDGLEAARTSFKQMNEFFSGMKGWAETTDAVYALFAEQRKTEQQKLREDKLEEQRAGAPVIITSSQSISDAKNIGSAEIDKMDVDVNSPGNNIARIIQLGKDDDK
jgi:hypothetical protein